MSRRRYDQPPKLVESPGGQLANNPYEQIIDHKGKPTYLIYRKNITLPPPNKTWRNHYITDTTITDTDQDPPITYIPMKRLPWKPYGPLPQEKWSKQTTWIATRQFLFEHLDVPDLNLYDVLTGWIFASWIPERWDSVPYLFFFGPVGSGKTRGLDCLSALCYRGLQAPNMSGASIFRGIEMWSPTLLLDETEIYNKEDRIDVVGILNAGYRRGQYAIRVVKVESDTPIIGLFDVFGFKALSGTRGHRETLESRSIIINMFKASRKVRFMLDANKAREIRIQLLLWRMEQLGEIDGSDESDEYSKGIADVPEALAFADGRFAEKYYSLYMIANEGRDNIITYAKGQYEIEQMAEETSIEAEVTQAIMSCRELVINGVVKSKDIAVRFNEPRNDKEQWKTKSVSTVVKRLGFHSKRSSDGSRGYIWSDGVLERNMRRYGLQGERGDPLGDVSDLSDSSIGSVWIHPGAVKSGGTIGDFYPVPLRREFGELGRNPRGVFEGKILEYAPKWEDFKVGALIMLMIEKGELMETDDGELVPVG